MNDLTKILQNLGTKTFNIVYFVTAVASANHGLDFMGQLNPIYIISGNRRYCFRGIQCCAMVFN